MHKVKHTHTQMCASQRGFALAWTAERNAGDETCIW